MRLPVPGLQVCPRELQICTRVHQYNGTAAMVNHIQEICLVQRHCRCVRGSYRYVRGCISTTALQLWLTIYKKFVSYNGTAETPPREEETKMTGDDLQVLGVIPYAKPRYPGLATYKQRLETFDLSWTGCVKQTSHELAESGFFFCGLSDHMRCFFCGNGFRNWEPADDPWTLHAQWYPECTFVNIKKDAQFIKNARESSQRRTIKPIDEHLLTGLMEGLGFFPALIEHFGFPDVCVRPALRLYLKSTKDLLPFVTEARCIELMLWYMQESTKAEMGLRGIHHEDVEGRVEPANLEWQSAPSDMETVATANEMDVDVVGSMSGFMSTNLGLRALPSPVETEAEETTIVANEMDVETGEEATDFDATSHVETVMNTSTPTSWAADILCKVCFNNALSVVLLPCRHMVTCSNCLVSMRNCPICRRTISHVLRPIIS
ncbi:baculoviral IAP repeat-containing protein 8-like [Procambarus clarkii]|uniref:baculoviral IAP repeat-containing protein 8-like n=2 Tax=Procambarus clarkii TaxID=6728 RepID=UPI003743FF7D